MCVCVCVCVCVACYSGGVILDHFINDMQKLRADGGEAPAAASDGTATTSAAATVDTASPAVTTMPSMYSSEFHVYRNELFEGEDDDDGVTEGSFFDD